VGASADSRPHGCYAAAGRWAIQSTEVVYIEGFALDSEIDAWIPHAWLTDASGEVIDLAWDAPGRAYHGVQIPASEAATHVRVTGHPERTLDLLVAKGWTPPESAGGDD
jgi:hypothetical protein